MFMASCHVFFMARGHVMFIASDHMCSFMASGHMSYMAICHFRQRGTRYCWAWRQYWCKPYLHPIVSKCFLADIFSRHLIGQLQWGKAASVSRNIVHKLVSKLCLHQGQQYLVPVVIHGYWLVAKCHLCQVDISFVSVVYGQSPHVIYSH